MTGESTAVIATDKARRYMSQLVKHFAHKLPTELGETDGHIVFDFGRCDLEARSDALVLRASAPDAEAKARLEGVIVRHLERFAFREPVEVNWSAAG